MAVSPARAAAFEILLKVDREQSYASELLHSARFAKLSSADHGLATELVMGVLRWRSLLDRRLAGLSSQKLERLDDEVLAALRLGAYQLQFLSRIPARAAIFESVELAKAARKVSAASFVNAVLRKLAASIGGSGSGVKSDVAVASVLVPSVGEVFAEIRNSPDSITLAERSAHPEWLTARWVERFGLDAACRICGHDQDHPTTAIHAYDEGSLEELVKAGVELSPGRLLTKARVVLWGDVTHTRAFEQGRISIQDEGSQLIALLVGRGEKILDCCAAPGGKTALIAGRNAGSAVVAAELHPHRARLLRGLAREANIRVVAADARQLPFSGLFDRILVDVPCSGTGTLARNPEIKWRLTIEDLEDLQARQIAILKSALARLDAGGRLVYSTCSLEREENEAVVEVALAGAVEFSSAEFSSSGFSGSEFSIVDCGEELERLRQAGELCVEDIGSLLSGRYLRTIPGVHPCDGFFAAILEKKA